MLAEYWQLQQPDDDFDEEDFINSWTMELVIARARQINYTIRPGCFIDQINAYWFATWGWCHLPFSDTALDVACSPHGVWSDLPIWSNVAVFPAAGHVPKDPTKSIGDIIADIVNRCPCMVCLGPRRTVVGPIMRIEPSIFDQDVGTALKNDSISDVLMQAAVPMYNSLGCVDEEDAHFVTTQAAPGPDWQGWQGYCRHCNLISPLPLPAHWKTEHLTGLGFHHRVGSVGDGRDCVDCIADVAPACAHVPAALRSYMRYKLSHQQQLFILFGDVRHRFYTCLHCASYKPRGVHPPIDDMERWGREWCGR